MDKGDSDSADESEAKSPLLSDDDEEYDLHPGTLPAETAFTRSLNEIRTNDTILEQVKDTRSADTKRRSEEIAKWELANKREASRMSSMRCQQRKRKRLEELKEEQGRLKNQNQTIVKQNTFLRLLISTIRETISAGMPPHGMQTNPIVVAQAGTAVYNQGVLGVSAVQQQQPQQFGAAIPQIPATQNLNLSLALMASMNQQIPGMANPAQPLPVIINPMANPPQQVQQQFVAPSTTINPGTITTTINPQQMQINLIHNAMPAQNTLPTLQNFVVVAQSGLQGGNTQQANPVAAFQQQMIFQQTNQQTTNQQTPQGRTISINMNEEEEKSAFMNSRSESNE